MDHAQGLNESDNVEVTMRISCANGVAQIACVRDVNGHDGKKAKVMLTYLRMLVRSVVAIINNGGALSKWSRFLSRRSNDSISRISTEGAGRDVDHFSDALRLNMDVRVVRYL